MAICLAVGLVYATRSLLAELYFEEAFSTRVKTIEQAFDYLEQARQWFPLEQRMRIAPTMAHIRTGGRVDAIVASLRDALRVDPNRGDLLEKLVIFELAMGERERAHQDALRYQILTHKQIDVPSQLKQEQ